MMEYEGSIKTVDECSDLEEVSFLQKDVLDKDMQEGKSSPDVNQEDVVSLLRAFAGYPLCLTFYSHLAKKTMLRFVRGQFLLHCESSFFLQSHFKIKFKLDPTCTLRLQILCLDLYFWRKDSPCIEEKDTLISSVWCQAKFGCSGDLGNYDWIFFQKNRWSRAWTCFNAAEVRIKCHDAE